MIPIEALRLDRRIFLRHPQTKRFLGNAFHRAMDRKSNRGSDFSSLFLPNLRPRRLAHATGTKKHEQDERSEVSIHGFTLTKNALERKRAYLRSKSFQDKTPALNTLRA